MIQCPICLKEHNNKKYCSKSCHGKSTLGNAPRTKEWREKISAALRGLKRTAETKNKIRLAKLGHRQTPEQIAKRVAKNRGQKRSDEVKKRMSESAKKVDLSRKARGPKQWKWRGGITPENERIRHSSEYVNWRRGVFERDNFTCVLCGQWGGKLNADHIKPFSLFPELRFALENGRTLCKSCHIATDTYAGKLKTHRNSSNELAKPEPK